MGRILRFGAKVTSLQRQGQSLWKPSRDTSKARRRRRIKKEPTGNGSLKNYDAFIPRAFWERPGFSAWNSIKHLKIYFFVYILPYEETIGQHLNFADKKIICFSELIYKPKKKRHSFPCLFFGFGQFSFLMTYSVFLLNALLDHLDRCPITYSRKYFELHL